MMKFTFDTVLEPGRRYGISVVAGESVSVTDYGQADKPDQVELSLDFDAPQGEIEPVEP